MLRLLLLLLLLPLLLVLPLQALHLLICLLYWLKEPFHPALLRRFQILRQA